jgi:hypothetical protein
MSEMPDLTRRQIALILGAAFAVLTLVIGVYGIATGPNEGANEDRHGVIGTGAGGDSNALGVVQRDPTAAALPQTSEPIAYARAVAGALFAWDTTGGYLPADYQAPVLADADPSGEEAPGLITDVTTYFPTIDQWLDLATLEVTQSLAIDSAVVPASWPSIVEQAYGQLGPGTTAVTITGTRERGGAWNGKHVTTSSPVAFTVFIACPPSFDRCHILRLSELDNPLR